MRRTEVESTGYWTNKVPEVVLTFWIIKILSTTVGETAADFLAFDAGWGQGPTTALTMSLLLVALLMQLRRTRHEPWLYWLCVVLVSIVGTQITDILTDALGVSLYVSSAAFAVALGVAFTVWWRLERTLSIREVTTRRRELFYWSAILLTFALGTAVGDLATEALALGFGMGALVFGALLAATAVLWKLRGHAVLTFWIAYVLTRPFGAALGDLLTQDRSNGGLGFGAAPTSLVFLMLIVSLVAVAQIGNRERLQ